MYKLQNQHNILHYGEAIWDYPDEALLMEILWKTIEYNVADLQLGTVISYMT